MRIWKQKSLLLFLATALMLSFQNCSAPSASSPVGVVSQATSGNGDAYDGKLVVTAPEIVTPGQTVEVSILGGAPPYQLTSDSSSAQIVETSVGIYALTVDVNTSGGVISLQATDSNGELATTEIQVWGINRWFFSQPTGLAVDSRGHTFVLEADRPSLIELDANGDLVQRYTNTDLSADLVSPTHLEIDALDNLYISDSSSRVVVIDAVTKRVQRIIEDSADQYWSDCGGIQDMKVDAGGAIFVACRDRLFQFSAEGGFQFQVSLQGSVAGSVGAFVIDSNQQVLVSKPDGWLEVLDLEGNSVSSFRINKEGETGEYGYHAWDLELASGGRVAVLPRGVGRAIFVERGTGDFLGIIGQDYDVDQVYYHGFRDIEAAPGGGFLLTASGSNHVMLLDDTLFVRRAFGFSSSDSSAFYFPENVIVQNGVVTVHDRRNYRVVQFNNRGEILRTISRPEQSLWLKYCHGMDVDDQGVIYIVCDDQGESVRIDTGGAVTPLPGVYGQSISIDSAGNFWVSRVWPGRVYRYNSNWQQQVEAQVDASEPRGILAFNDQVYVVDSSSSEVLVLDQQAEEINRFSLSGATLDRPQKIVFDSTRDLFYVTDSSNDRLVVFDREGTYQSAFGARGFGSGQFRQPTGIDVDEQGNVFVVDTNNSRLQIFSQIVQD